METNRSKMLDVVVNIMQNGHIDEQGEISHKTVIFFITIYFIDIGYCVNGSRLGG